MGCIVFLKKRIHSPVLTHNTLFTVRFAKILQKSDSSTLYTLKKTESPVSGCQQAFQRGYFYASTIQCQQSVVLHLVQSATHIQTTVIQFIRQLVHQDMESLGSCRIDTVQDKKTDNPLTQRRGTLTPWLMRQLLGLRGKDVQQVQAEHQEVFRQSDHLIFIDGDKTGIRLRHNGLRITLVIAKDGFWLKDIRGLQFFHHPITTVIRTALYTDGAADEEIEMSTGSPLLDNRFTLQHLAEAETRMSSYQFEVITAHPLKQRELKQFVEYLQGSHRKKLFYDLAFQ